MGPGNRSNQKVKKGMWQFYGGGSKSSRVIFNGGSSMNWMIAKAKITKFFVQEDVWDLIASQPKIPNPVQVQANEALQRVFHLMKATALEAAGDDPIAIDAANALEMGPLPYEVIEDVDPPVTESVFILVEPTVETFVNRQIHSQREMTERTFNELETSLNEQVGMVGFPAARVNTERFRLHTDRSLQLLKISNTRVALERGLENAKIAWESAKMKHGEKTGKCMKVFNMSLGSTPLALIHRYLSRSEFRQAWNHLNHHFALEIGGQQSMMEVISALGNVVFNPKETSILEHIDFLQRIASEMIMAGKVDLPESLILEYVLKSIEKSSVTTFIQDIEHIRRLEKPTMALAIGLFQKTESKTLMELHVHKNDANTTDVQQAQLITEVNKLRNEVARLSNPHQLLNITRPNIKGKFKGKCNGCGKMGHTLKNCWKKVPCFKCGKLGHGAKFCRDAKASSSSASDSAPNPVNLFDRKVNFKKSDDYHDLNDRSSRHFVKFNLNSNIVDNSTVVTTMDIDEKFNNTNPDIDIQCINTSTPNICNSGVHIDVSVVGSGPDQSLSHELSEVVTCAETAVRRNCTCTMRIIIDSGASCHMFPHDSILKDVVALNGTVRLGDGMKVIPIMGIGQTNIDCIQDVRLVPDVNFGVISIGIFDTMGFLTVFENGVCTIKDRQNQTVLVGHLENNLYFVTKDYMSKLKEGTVCPLHGSLLLRNGYVLGVHECGSAPRKRTNTTIGLSALEILHRIWGHLSEFNIKRALKLGMVHGSKYTYEDVKDLKLPVCFDCLKGRMKSAIHDLPNLTEWKRFEKIGVDFKGFFPIRSIHGFKGFILISDFKTSFVTAVMVKSKGGVLKILDDYNSMVVNQYNGSIKVLQSDYDTIFTSEQVTDWCKKRGIRVQVSAPYVHWQNGQIERDIQNVMDRSRILMHTFKVPPVYWDYAVLISCYLINRSPISNDTATPIELATGIKPDISHLIPFYAPGIYHVSKEERKGKGGFTPKGRLCRMLGYDERSKNTYIVLDILTRSIYTRKSCIFDLNNRNDPQFSDFDQMDPLDIDDTDYTPENWVTSPVVSHDDDDDDDYDGDDNDDGGEYPYWKEYANVEVDDCHLKVVGVDDWNSDQLYISQNVIKLPDDPRSVHDALSGDSRDLWMVAIRKELEQFNTFKIFGPAEQAGRAMKTRLLLKYAYNNDYSIKAKARLVVCGYSQVKNVDYFETYSPTTTVSVILLLLQLAVSLDYPCATYDVSAAFLQGKQDIRQFAVLPRDITPDDEPLVRVEVLGNWYGTKQAPKIWNDRYDQIMILLGFVRCPVLPCLYYLHRGDDVITNCVHVDDGCVIGTSKDLIEQFITGFNKHVYKVTLLWEFKRYLGMDIMFSNNNRSVTITQTSYVKDKFSGFTKTVLTPMTPIHNLRIQSHNLENDSLLPDTGKFRYLADRTRPDILVATGEISTGGDKYPSNEHIKVSVRTKNYLSTTADLGLVFRGALALIYLHIVMPLM
ncbi:MAG: DDE-type integrase/transposase/recombinase [Flavobacteriales bacterium]|nr:DDE-type integrase/transposase/recombinase [Flavobacteriales bacterium]